MEEKETLVFTPIFIDRLYGNLRLGNKMKADLIIDFPMTKHNQGLEALID